MDNDYIIALSLYEQEVADRELALALNTSDALINVRSLIHMPNIHTEKHNEQYIPCMRYSDEAIVILYPDNNDPTFSSYDVDLQKRMKYMTHVYHVFLKRVSTLREAINVVSEIKKKYKICEINLGGHGTATTLHWPSTTLKVNKDETDLRELFSMLEPNAPILTLSCQNGKKIQGKNMLQYIAGIAKGHRVIGTTCNNGKHLRLKLTSPKPLNIKYTCNGRDVTSTEICY